MEPLSSVQHELNNLCVLKYANKNKRVTAKASLNLSIVPFSFVNLHVFVKLFVVNVILTVNYVHLNYHLYTMQHNVNTDTPVLHFNKIIVIS